MIPLAEVEAAAIWRVLVDHAGANDFGRENFLHTQTADVRTEYRFVGSLGFGGKFRRNRVWIGDVCSESWTVDCYREDLTPERQAVIDTTNAALADLRRAVAQ